MDETKRKRVPDTVASDTAAAFTARDDGIELARELDAVRELIERTVRPEGGRLEHRERVAVGGMGVLDRGVDRSLRREIAIKSSRDEASRSSERATRLLIREAQIVGQLEHPNVVPVYDLGTTPDGRACFTMKLVRGQTLVEILRSLPPGGFDRDGLLDLIDVVLRVCDALAFAHSRGVIHCDVKAANVMVGRFGQVYLMDWGIAELVDPAPTQGDTRITSSIEPFDEPSIRGTVSCMAPEQALAKPVDARTDVFGVGALLYHLLCRRLPYGVGDRLTAMARAIGAEFDRPSAVAGGIPRELERIVLKAMERDPKDRYQSIEALKHDLVRFTRGGGELGRIELSAGQFVVREGEIGNAAYIIEEGRCEVLKRARGGIERVREMGPGSVFGETAILSPGPRTATVRTLERTVLVEVTKDVLDREVAAMKSWMRAFILTLARRFREREAEV